MQDVYAAMMPRASSAKPKQAPRIACPFPAYREDVAESSDDDGDTDGAEDANAEPPPVVLRKSLDMSGPEAIAFMSNG